MTHAAGQPRLALIATVLNEGRDLDAWLAAIDAQTHAPARIVIVDGGSGDDTFERLQRWAGQRAGERDVQQVPGATIAAGRNAALVRLPDDIEIVAVTDAGTVAEPGWLAALRAPFDDPAVDVVAGFWSVRRATLWERALAAATMPDAVEIRPGRFLPSSRSVAFRRRWLDVGMRYPAWLDYCEDLIFDLSLLRAGSRMQTALDARVEFRVRPSLRAFWTQYLRYARGDGKAGLFARRHAVRYATYGVLVLGLLRHRPHELALLAAAGGVYVSRPARRIMRHRSQVDNETPTTTIASMMLAAGLVMVGDVAKMVGYPQGLRWRRRTYGGLGRRTSWQRITPEGELQRPAAWTTGSRVSTSPHADAPRAQSPSHGAGAQTSAPAR